MLTAIIPASGFSRRMGENKLLKKLGTKEIIRYSIENILKINFDEIILVYSNPDIYEISKQYDITKVFNEKAHLGQSESIKAGVRNADQKSDYMFFMGDMPFLDESIIKKCISEFEKDKSKIIVPKVNGNKKNPVIFPNYLRDEILKLSGDVGARNLIEKYNSVFLDFEDSIYFKDIDTLADFDALEDYYKKMNG